MQMPEAALIAKRIYLQEEERRGAGAGGVYGTTTQAKDQNQLDGIQTGRKEEGTET